VLIWLAAGCSGGTSDSSSERPASSAAELSAVTRSACSTAPTHSSQPIRSDLTTSWNNWSSTTVTIYPSTGSSFGWGPAYTNGGWDDRSKSAAGDFNGDGIFDIATIWNNGGTATIAVRLGTGTAFTVATWSDGANTFRDSDVWLPGDFNGDGLVDLANVELDGARTGMRVFLSTGSSFEYSPWWLGGSSYDLGEQRYVVGDFDNDGRADIFGTSPNYNFIWWSTGSQFSEATAYNIAPFDASARWLAGDFTGDGRSDLAEVWKEGDKARVAVYPSTGNMLHPFTGWTQWDNSGGGWIDDANANWTAGDFDGDGKTDLATAWNLNEQTVLTVRRSNGSSFVPQEWLNPAGGWAPSTQWCAGKFTR